ncbi:acyltransferase [Motiliproteus sp. MSK22-1]|uniref:acyltransferase family protein n=1 Tax=Motiliproteus sp. MSK22-1 TaxID=1897630 RepID=UPI00117D7B2B|nr:acyltransferase [Motiliproteus sp. MSK22-1]
MQEKRDYKGTNFITGLRAIAIFFVFLIHSGGGGLRELGGAYNLFVDFGKYGVSMFFVISGFTIFHQLFSGNYSLSKFLKIRFSRISIPYFPIILLIFIYINMGGQQFNGWANKFNNGEISIDNLFAHLLYLASFNLKYANTIIGVEWSLHIEILFYFIFGYLIVNQFLKINFKNLFFSLILAIFIAAFIHYLGHINKVDRLLVHWMPFRYAWMFLLGGIGYHYRNVIHLNLTRKTLYQFSNTAIFLSITCILFLLNLKEINGVAFVNEGVFAVLTFILIIFVRDGAFFSIILNNKFSIWLGTISFSFYLFHYIFIQARFANYLTNNSASLLIINFILTALISHFWYKFFEVRIYRNFKRYIV